MAATLGDMKTRIANELRRDDIADDIANAIGTAIEFYQYDRFPSFNTSSVVPAPVADTDSNEWTTVAAPLIRARAKALIYADVAKIPELATMFNSMAQELEAKLKKPRTFQSLTGLTARTLGYMKAKIANEIERGELTNEIAAAIATAIGYYQGERFIFSESRDFTFTTSANKYLYTAADFPDLANLVAIDYCFAYIGGQPYALAPLKPKVMEWGHLTVNDPVGQPLNYTFFSQSLQFYPTPNTTYPIRIGGPKVIAAPASDTATGSPWMNDGEVMIRSRAKAELYQHIETIKDPAKAQMMRDAAQEAFDQLRERTIDITNEGGDFIVDAWGY